MVKKLLIDYKFHEKSYISHVFSEFLENEEEIYHIFEEYDIIIPVPMHKFKKKMRGYNQTELIVIELAKKHLINVQPNLLIKCKLTKTQSTLSQKERENEQENSYQIAKFDEVKSKKILIFDDIYTTGSTVNACAKLLKNEGASQIDVLTIAKVEKYME